MRETARPEISDQKNPAILNDNNTFEYIAVPFLASPLIYLVSVDLSVWLLSSPLELSSKMD